MPDAGLIGSALTGAANAYFEALHGPSLAEEREAREEKQRKAVEDRLRVESQRKLDEAQALWMGRRPAGTGGRDRVKALYDENNKEYILNLDTGDTKYTGNTRYARPLTPQQQFDMDQLANIEKYFGKPHTELTQEEWNHPAVRDTVDLLRKRQVIYATATGFALARDIVGATPGVPIRETPATPSGRQAPAPSTETGTSPAPMPTPTPGKPAATVPAPRPTPPTTRGVPTGGKPQVVEAAVLNFMPGYRPMNESELQIQLDDLTKRQAESPSNITLTQLEAVKRVIAERRSGTPAEPASPSTTGPSPPAVPPGKQAAPTGDVPVIQTGPQAEAGQQARDAARIKQEQEQRAKNAALAGKVTEDQARLANDYFAKKVPGFDSAYYPLLGETQKKQINDDIQRPIVEKREREKELFKGKLRTEHLQAMKQAQPYINELQAMETTRFLSEKLMPLLRQGTVGVGGQGATIINTLASWLPGYKSQFQKEAERQLREEGVQGALTKAALDARIAAMVEGNAKELQYESFFSPAASLLEVYTSILAYGHAITIKRRFTGGSGAGRSGITVQDLNEAHAWFDPRLWKTNPDMMLARIQGLQTLIQEGKEVTKDMIRAFYVDPDAVDKAGRHTYPLLPYNPVSAQELERPAASAAPLPTAEEEAIMLGQPVTP